jgi:UDP-GlcNAc:undecaprenyl-phosphate/decaprenyl-phosphate GlcNAc-1-phosphate transferase
MNTLHYISPIAAYLITYLIVPVLRKLAFKVQLLDKPNLRKVHNNPVPLVGGISIFVASTLTLLFSLIFETEVIVYKNVFITAFILLLMGVIDDRFDLRASLKLGIQLILAHFIFVNGIKIESLHGLMGVFDLAPWAQYVLTIVAITGVVNAFNLMDGIDGLAAGIAILGLVVYTIISFIAGQSMMTLLFLTLIGSLIAFLRFNLSKKQKIFMGDAGSIVLGYVLVVSGISLLQSTQNSEYIALVTLGVITVLIVPVLDALRVFRRRAKSGKSPFMADKTHLHHLILNIGLQHNLSTIVILIIMVLIMVFGYLSFSLLGLTFSIFSILFIFYCITSAIQFNDKLNQWKNYIQETENNR